MGTLIPESREDFYQEDTAFKRGLSEVILTKVGASVNFINNRIIDRYAFNFGGFYRVQSTAQYSFPSIFIKTPSKISYYTVKIDKTVASGNNTINFKVIDEDGIDLGNLFTTPPRINGNGLTNPMVGYDVEAAAEIRKVIALNFSNGVIDVAYETLPAGYELKPYLVSGSDSALNLSINIGIKAQS